MLALFAFLGSLGSIYGGAVTAFLLFGPKPWQDAIARIEAIARTVEGDNRAAMLTVGGLTPRVVRLEEHDQTHGEQLALLRPTVKVERSR